MSGIEDASTNDADAVRALCRSTFQSKAIEVVVRAVVRAEDLLRQIWGVEGLAAALTGFIRSSFLQRGRDQFFIAGPGAFETAVNPPEVGSSGRSVPQWGQ